MYPPAQIPFVDIDQLYPLAEAMPQKGILLSFQFQSPLLLIIRAIASWLCDRVPHVALRQREECSRMTRVSAPRGRPGGRTPARTTGAGATGIAGVGGSRGEKRRRVAERLGRWARLRREVMQE
jgi:hypothetical protein